MFTERVPGIIAIILLSGLATSAQEPDCRHINVAFQKKVCSGIENNQASYIKELMERKSGQHTLERILEWTSTYYDCVYCMDEPGFRGGSMLRKVVFEDALSVAFFFVYEARVNMNAIERDGRTLANWLLDDTEMAFDAAFETEVDADRRYLIKQIQLNQKYFNIFRNNGALFRSELRKGGSKL